MKHKILIIVLIIGLLSCKKNESATAIKPAAPTVTPIPWKETSTIGGSNYVLCMAVSGNNIFAGSDDGLFLSSNNGVSWSSVGINFKVLSLAISGNSIYAGTQNGGIFLSSDIGVHWVAINNGFNPTIPNIQSLAISGNNIYAGTDGNGMYMSNNSRQNIITSKACNCN